MTPVVDAVGLTADGPISILSCSFAGTGFKPSGTFNAGLLKSAPGKLISTYVIHPCPRVRFVTGVSTVYPSTDIRLHSVPVVILRWHHS